MSSRKDIPAKSKKKISFFFWKNYPMMILKHQSLCFSGHFFFIVKKNLFGFKGLSCVLFVFISKNERMERNKKKKKKKYIYIYNATFVLFTFLSFLWRIFTSYCDLKKKKYATEFQSIKKKSSLFCLSIYIYIRYISTDLIGIT